MDLPVVVDLPVRRARRLALAGILAVATIAAVPWPAVAADPTPSPTRDGGPAATLAPAATPTPATVTTQSIETRTGPAATLAPAPTATPAPTKVLIYRESAMVTQYTNYWCVPAATQSAVNLIRGTSDRSRATQERYYKGTRAHNRYSYATKGNDPQGWAWAMTYYSGGQASYDDRAFTSKTAALLYIVDSIDRTGEPVGVTVHGGTHAWLVLGYRAALDPAAPWDASRRTILGYYVSGPLGSPSDPWPYKYLSMADFRDHFTRYHEWQFSVIWEDRWVVIGQ